MESIPKLPVQNRSRSSSNAKDIRGAFIPPVHLNVNVNANSVAKMIKQRDNEAMLNVIDQKVTTIADTQNASLT